MLGVLSITWDPKFTFPLAKGEGDDTGQVTEIILLFLNLFIDSSAGSKFGV